MIFLGGSEREGDTERERKRKKTAGDLLASRRKTKIVSSKQACETVIFREMRAAEVRKRKKILLLKDLEYGKDVFCEYY